MLYVSSWRKKLRDPYRHPSILYITTGEPHNHLEEGHGNWLTLLGIMRGLLEAQGQE